MKGQGIFAEQIDSMFQVSARRFGLDRKLEPLDVSGFRRPRVDERQMEFDL
ncbi:MAG: hypothetical protein AAGB46_01910 [Verrucomicrobiota bacterium]